METYISYTGPAGPRAVPNRTPPNANSQRRPRPAKPIDARAFGASGNNGQPPRVIRSARAQNFRRNPNAGKKPLPKKGDRKARGPRSRRPENDNSEDPNAAQIDKIEQEQIIKGRPTPVRYEPQEIDFATLQQTWPSVPTSAQGRSSAVLGHLASRSERYANGYVDPLDFARRLYQRKAVLFYSKTEKVRAMKAVRHLWSERSDETSRRKGEEVMEVKRPIFRGLENSRSSVEIISQYAKGSYPPLMSGEDEPAVIGKIVKNLRSNATYETEGKESDFLRKVESLLSSGRAKST